MLIISQYCLTAQNTIINNEIGVFLGPAYIQTDYGEANNFSSSTANVGLDIGIAYVADFSDSRYSSGLFSWISEHLKTRIELSYTSTKLNHDEARTDQGSQLSRDQFKGVTGEVKMLHIGIMGEWYFKSISLNTKKFKPYLLTGISYTNAKSEMSISSFGLPTIYVNTPTDTNLYVGENSAISFTYGLGGRYEINDNLDIILEGRFQSFMSDRIEGIDTNIPGDKKNDAQVIFKLGAVYRFN